MSYEPKVSPPSTSEPAQFPPIPPRMNATYSSNYSASSKSQLDSSGDGLQGQSLPSFYDNRQGESEQACEEPRKSRIRNLMKGWRLVILGSWLNVLLAVVPVSWALTLTMKNTHGMTFAACIIALIPLVRLHDVVTRELAMRIGGNKTGLLNGSMSNFVEIIVAISALHKCELQVVQSSLVGSMLSKLLLVLGLCFLAGGMKFSEQGFDATAMQIHSSLLSLSVTAVVLPAAYHFTLGNGSTGLSLENQKRDILKMSHGVSILLLFIYVAYLVFQFWSHTYLYGDDLNKRSAKLSTVIKEKRHRHRGQSCTPSHSVSFRNPNTLMHPTLSHSQSNPLNSSLPAPELSSSTSATMLVPPRRPFVASESSFSLSGNDELSTAQPTDSCSSRSTGMEKSLSLSPNILYHNPQSTVRLVPHGPASGGIPMAPVMTRELTMDSGITYTEAFPICSTCERQEPPQEINVVLTQRPLQEPQLSWFITIVTMILVTGLVAVTVDWLVESMDSISTTVSKEWVGLILLPAISSIAECITAVRVSVKDELSLSVSVAVGSTLQTALFVIPFTILLAWVTDKPLSLLMDPFQSMVLYVAVNTVNYVVADGKSNWLEGLILICLYVIIAVSFWFYPGTVLHHNSCDLPF